MATAQTLSPSAEGILHSPNADTVINTSVESGTYQRQEVDFTSAPEIGGLEDGAQQIQQAAKHNRGKRRKRRNSFNENPNAGFGHQNGKRRRGNSHHHKRQNSAGGRIILPTKFLLGGNINDPLNLNSMMDENINRALNAVTPSSSPLPPRNSIIDIVTPQDVTDPLGLNSSDFAEPSAAGDLPKNRNKRKRRRKSHAMKLQQEQQQSQQNSDAAVSNSDDQTQNTSVEAQSGIPAQAVDGSRKNVPQNRRKKRSPFVFIGHHLSVPIPQANIRDPIVSPAVPQDTRRFRNSFGSKHRRRKHGSGKPGTSDAGIQTDSSEMLLEEKLRCGSEKIPDRDLFSPIKRRRTVSENFSAPSHWDDEDLRKTRITSFFGDSVLRVADSPKKSDIYNLLPKPIGSCIEDEAENPESGKSPAKNYMNKESSHRAAEKEQSPCKIPENRRLSDEKKRKSEGLAQRRDSEHKQGKKQPSKKPFTAKFQYGNYNQYYGYRNHENFKDVRMECLKKEWFKEKDVLDIGCNAGHLTLLVARDYEPRKIVGIDIDESLIRTARNNIRHYASTAKSNSKFPASMAISLGPLVSPPVETGKDETTAAFPNNVNFFQGNYVPKKDEFLQYQEPEYDVIMCMSVSKWVHLNWGDEGLTRMFRRVFKQLRAGGMFILEPQQWSSYSAKKRMCEKFSEAYRSIKLRPESFPNFLMREVGFEKFENVTLQKKNKSPGFQRPIQVYYKPE